MAWQVDFVVEAAAGLVGVFAGVLLALGVERARRRREVVAERARTAESVVDLRKTILTSVVRNTSEAKRLAMEFERKERDPYLFDFAFELAVWAATQPQFMLLAPLEERVLFTRFFDRVARCSTLLEFGRRVRSEVEVRQLGTDAGDIGLYAKVDDRLREAAEDTRLDGIVLVTDFGGLMHQRLLGLQPAIA
jgi:hypothetical protein